VIALEKGALACVCVYLRLGRVLSLSHQHVLARLLHLYNEEEAENALERGVFALEKGAFALEKGMFVLEFVFLVRLGRARPFLSARVRPTLPPFERGRGKRMR